MPKALLINENSYSVIEFINMNLEYLDHCFHVNIFLAFLAPDVLELNCLLSDFYSLKWSHGEQTWKWGIWEIICGNGSGKKKMELFPIEKLLHSVCFHTKQMNILSTKPFSNILWKKPWHLKYFTLILHLDSWERTKNSVSKANDCTKPRKLLKEKWSACSNWDSKYNSILPVGFAYLF